MGQKLMRDTLQAEAACQDSAIDMGQDESVLILIKHCRDMKQQETRLRLITLLLLLSCMAVFVLTTGVVSRQRGNSGATGRESAVEQSPAYSKQESQYPAAANLPSNSQRLRIHLRPNFTVCQHDKQNFKWDLMFGGENNSKVYDREKRAIVIPKTGIYFVYVRIVYKSRCADEEKGSKRLLVRLQSWNDGYRTNVHLADAKDIMTCPAPGIKSLYVGQLFDLLEGDHVSVWIEEGYKMIEDALFGAFLT